MTFFLLGAGVSALITLFIVAVVFAGAAAFGVAAGLGW